MELVYYTLDTETTGFDEVINDVIELSIHRNTDGDQKTWFIKPTNINTIEAGALRVNGHKLEDLLHQTKHGRETYLPAEDVIVEVENWIMEDGVTSEDRVMVGQLVSFDKNMLTQLWKKCNSFPTFPFGRKMMDTIQVELLMKLLGISDSESFALSALTKKYGIKNDKAHTALADTKATVQLLTEQIKYIKKHLK